MLQLVLPKQPHRVDLKTASGVISTSGGRRTGLRDLVEVSFSHPY